MKTNRMVSSPGFPSDQKARRTVCGLRKNVDLSIRKELLWDTVPLVSWMFCRMLATILALWFKKSLLAPQGTILYPSVYLLLDEQIGCTLSRSYLFTDPDLEKWRRKILGCADQSKLPYPGF